MRNRTGCSECRERHVKCSRKPEATKCDRCVEHDRDCVQTSLHRFRPVKTVPLKKGRAGRPALRQNFTYDSQIWVDIPSKLDFGPPADDAGMSDNPASEEPPLSTSSAQRSSLRSGGILGDSPLDFPQGSLPSTPYGTTTQSSRHPNQTQQVKPVGCSHSSFPEHDPTPSRFNLQETSKIDKGSRIGIFQPSGFPELSHKSAPSPSMPRSGYEIYHPHASPATSMISAFRREMRPGILSMSPNAHSLEFSIAPSWPFQTSREAKLFHHYVKNISPWIDVCDSNSYFGREIPRRVAHHPIIASAIFALASRHLSLLSEANIDESPHYVDECLQILISILEDPLGHLDENLLAAVILLRSHEEFAENDERCHALGTTRLLNFITAGAGDGGFRESASWICLRQHIYLSLIGQEPLSLNLSNYHHSAVFSNQSDESWANRIIFIFANILNYVFDDGNTSQSLRNPARWSELDAQAEDWLATRPWYFSALWSNADRQQESGSWPELLTSHPAHAVGLQYYCLSKIILAIYDPKLLELGFASHRLRRRSESVVVENLRLAMGLAVSNPDVKNAMFQGSHILTVCGSYLQDKSDQDAAVEFLVGMTKTMGWATDHIIKNLQEQWQS